MADQASTAAAAAGQAARGLTARATPPARVTARPAAEAPAHGDAAVSHTISAGKRKCSRCGSAGHYVRTSDAPQDVVAVHAAAIKASAPTATADSAARKPGRKAPTCGKCHQAGHTARSCSAVPFGGDRGLSVDAADPYAMDEYKVHTSVLIPLARVGATRPLATAPPGGERATTVAVLTPR
ncbi:hypothetical protein I4F81_000894 [Pyropia yezoensis]|uniref:Uncharacterized protein n=1 Tax=Pyropia yezoensis TaxID=2788 RepID=A0ACC3BJZ6_PYRYE|nr:hypothetical protein I4F81_000894 [Neopyropia yezoensis]